MPEIMWTFSTPVFEAFILSLNTSGEENLIFSITCNMSFYWNCHGIMRDNEVPAGGNCHAETSKSWEQPWTLCCDHLHHSAGQRSLQ